MFNSEKKTTKRMINLSERDKKLQDYRLKDTRITAAGFFFSISRR
jgi:hypothetical protein